MSSVKVCLRLRCLAGGREAVSARHGAQQKTYFHTCIARHCIGLNKLRCLNGLNPISALWTLKKFHTAAKTVNAAGADPDDQVAAHMYPLFMQELISHFQESHSDICTGYGLYAACTTASL